MKYRQSYQKHHAYLALGNNLVVSLILMVSYSFDSTNLSYATIVISSRARARGILNECILRRIRIDQWFGYKPTQTGYESSEFGYETTEGMKPFHTFQSAHSP